MARKLKAKKDHVEAAMDALHDDEPTRDTSNVAARGDMIRNAHAELNRIEAEIKSLMVEAGAKRKEAGNVYRRLKSNLGTKREDVQIARRIIELEGDERNETLDTIREVYAALAPGETVDWIGATGAGSDGFGADQTKPDEYSAGFKEGEAGKTPTSDSELHMKGWNDAQAGIARSMKGKGAPASAAAH